MVSTFLLDKARPPIQELLIACLGKVQPHWESVIRHTIELSPGTSEVWHFAGPKIGWSLRLVQKERVLLYLTPGENGFRAGLVLGKKAFATARECGLSPAAIALVETAPVYAEGHGIRLEVTTRQHVQVLEELLKVKVGPTASKPPRKRA